ncbi:Hypothetical protein NTJ_15997 [Nesidiocoris tenuis]|uniref:Secreted protein n=1 Tax=Nesidiocoris tenuis TaxID=355587 RepID=A0ABN7BFW2_9HEMI|nr:Hypothetical protein NTJ_15997 [Nesidiocoris tenuis]
MGSKGWMWGWMAWPFSWLSPPLAQFNEPDEDVSGRRTSAEKEERRENKSDRLARSDGDRLTADDCRKTC